MAINKIITDPEALEKMIGRYEKAIEENKAALDKLLNAQSYEKQIAEWDERLDHAKKSVESANKEASEVIASANELLKEAHDQLEFAEAMKKVAEQATEAQKKERVKLEARADQLFDIEKKLNEKEAECEKYQAELAEWVSSAKYLIGDFPGTDS